MLFCKLCHSSGEERNFEVASGRELFVQVFYNLLLFQTLKGYKKEQGQHYILAASS
jgi:hypothetical protein